MCCQIAASDRLLYSAGQLIGLQGSDLLGQFRLEASMWPSYMWPRCVNSGGGVVPYGASIGSGLRELKHPPGLRIELGTEEGSLT